MTPHLVRWHEQYADQGLVIIEVDNGQIDSLADLKQHIEQEQIPFAVVHDASGEITNRYGVQVYPTACLIDTTGQIVWAGNPTPTIAGAIIRKAVSNESPAK